MQLPPSTSGNTFNDLPQALPSDIEPLARQCKAFQRARKLKTPAQLLHVVFFYSGPPRLGSQVVFSNVKVSGTNRSDTETSQLPVPLRPATCQ